MAHPQTVKNDKFYALLLVVDLGAITPLPDGTNTNSMEFVIQQADTKKSLLASPKFMAILSKTTDALQKNT